MNQHNISQQVAKTLPRLKRAVKLIALALFVSKTGLAQYNKEKDNAFGVSISSTINSSGFGTLYSPGVFYTSGKHTVEAAPIFQKRDLHLSGARLSYGYTVFDGAKSNCKEYGNENLELFFFGSVNYHYSALLSKAQIRREEMVARGKETSIAYQDLKYTAVESYVGFGLNRKLSKKIKWSNLIGFGGWQTIEGEKNLDRDYTGPGISLKTSILIQL